MKYHFLEVMHRRREALQPSLDLRKHYLEATTAHCSAWSARPL